MNKLRVFLADDHAAVREGIKLLINSQPNMEVVGQAGDGQTALQMINEDVPDVVVMDVSMPVMSGVMATERLKKKFQNIHILALTRHNDQGYLRRLLQAGAQGYILKQAAPEILIEAIQIVASGGFYLDPSLASRVVDNYITHLGVKKGEAHGKLTGNEEEALRMIAWGYSNKEIASKLEVSVKTIEYYKAKSMEKLSLRSRPDIVRYALQQGWLQEI
jgi:DNA-binding NarL/FixJ family response regulator